MTHVLIDTLLFLGVYLAYRELCFVTPSEQPTMDLREARTRGLA